MRVGFFYRRIALFIFSQAAFAEKKVVQLTPPPSSAAPHWNLLALTDFLFMYPVTEERHVSVRMALR